MCNPKYYILYDIQRTKSYRSKCIFCGKSITDKFRLFLLADQRFTHIYCSGFVFSRLTEMASWNNLRLDPYDISMIRQMVRKF